MYQIMTDKNDGDWTLTKVDMAYDRIIMGDNPVNYYYGIMDGMNSNGYYINGNNKRNLNKNENCYIKIRLIFDDGG